MSFLEDMKSRLGIGKRQPSQMERPDWVSEYDDDDWMAVRNPLLGRNVAQKRARIIIWTIILSTPLCAILAIVGWLLHLSSETEPVYVPTSQEPVEQAEPVWIPGGEAAAENLVREWLSNNGQEVIWSVPYQSWQLNNLICIDGNPCEAHRVHARFADRVYGVEDEALVYLVVDSANGTLVGSTPSFNGRPIRNEPRSAICGAGLDVGNYAGLEDRLEEWANAWSDEDQSKLRDMSPSSGTAFLPQISDVSAGWRYTPGSLEILSVCQPPTPGVLFLEVTLGLVSQQCEECSPVPNGYELVITEESLRWLVQGPYLPGQRPLPSTNNAS